ncbi:hypothetical protein HZA33_02125 [Candidatus Pacearchaeota archaeon]|nr:hypothetical protein [Candidatus Pacearchaeota archaeon]
MKDLFRKSVVEKYEIDYIIFVVLSFIRGTQHTLIGKWLTSLFFIKIIVPFLTFFIVMSLGFILLRYIKNPKKVLLLMLLAYLVLEILFSYRP